MKIVAKNRYRKELKTDQQVNFQKQWVVFREQIKNNYYQLLKDMQRLKTSLQQFVIKIFEKKLNSSFKVFFFQKVNLQKKSYQRKVK